MEFGFFLKKTVTYFIEPFGMVLILFVIGLYFLFTQKNKRSKLFLSLTLGIMVLYSYPPFANYLVENLENKYPKYDYRQSVKYIHVLGGGHNVDPDQPLSSQIGGASVKRDLEGISIHKKSEGSKIIFTGYEGDTDTPTAIMNARLAKALGVKEENLIVNGLPKDTKEEAEFTKTIVGDESFILVTSATHMPRAMMLFESLGLNPIPAPTNFYKTEFDGYFTAPGLGSFNKSKIAMHEYIGILWSKIKRVIHTSTSS
jgi:uncharacterized SAM-binding protein YcdF (DUF218 family)